MNGKASKQQMTFPPMFNFCKDSVHVDDSFRNAEEINAPYLNDMLQPLYTKSYDNKAVHDKYGNRYTIENNILMKNGVELWPVNNEKFVKTDITEQVKDYLAFDLHNGNVYCYLRRSSGNTYELYYGAGVVNFRPGDSDSSKIVECRQRYINGNVVTVIYYDLNRYEYLTIYLNGMVVYSSIAYWYVQNQGASFSQVRANKVGFAPCIHIARIGNYYGVSLTSKAGTVNDLTMGSAFITIFFDATNSYQVGRNITASISFVSSSVTNNDALFISTSKSTTSVSRQLITNDWVNYYYYSASATDIRYLTRCSYIPSNYASIAQKYVIGTQTLYLNDARDTATFNVIRITEYNSTFSLRLLGNQGNRYRITGVSATISNPNQDYNGGGWQIGAGATNTTVSLAAYNVLSLSNTEISTSNQTSVTFSYRYFSGQGVPQVSYSSVSFGAYNTSGGSLYSTSAPPHYINNTNVYNVTYNTSVPSSNIRYYPNVLLDSGEMWAVYKFDVNTSKEENNNSYWPDDYKSNQNIHYKGTGLSISGSRYTVSSSATAPSGVSIVRSGSVSVNQNWVDMVIKMNNPSAVNPNALNNGVTETNGSYFEEIEFNSMIGEPIWCPGTSRLSSYNYYSDAVSGDPTITGNAEDLAIFVVGGSRVPIGSSNFNILYNVTTAGTSYVQGISYSADANTMGTLLTPWQSISETSYILYSGNKVVYKDKSNKWYAIEIVNETAELAAILEDSLIVVNTTSYFNCYDPLKNEKFHYATDYNGRLRHGDTQERKFQGAIATSASSYSAYPFIRYTGNGINPLYPVMPRYPVLSTIYPAVARYRCYIGTESIFRSNMDIEDKLPVDIFYSSQNSTNCEYRYSLFMLNNTKDSVVNHNIQGLSYPATVSSTSSLTPNIFTKYINGAGNNDLVIEGYDAYVLTYYDNEPYLLYSAATQTSNVYSTDDSFFVLQGQFYGIIGDKLYALSYSNGAISSMEAIIDLGSIKFLGNNPMIAFWWDPASRTIRSFTGDANLDTLYNASKFTDMSGLHWYDETTQSIFIDTDKGLLVFGPRNTYMIPGFTNVTNVQFSNDGVTHITSNGITYDMVYYKTDGYEVLPIDMETSFYGIGANEYTNIDRWDITLYDYNEDKAESYIKVGVRSLTDITVKSEEKTFKITPDMYDKWSNSVLIRYVPKLQKGQGIRLYVETPLTIQKIVPHVADLKTGTLTKRGV